MAVNMNYCLNELFFKQETKGFVFFLFNGISTFGGYLMPVKSL